MLDALTPSTSHWMIKTSYFARKSAVKTGWVVMRSTAALLWVLSQSVNAEVLSAPPIPAWKPVIPGRPIEAMLRQVQCPSASHFGGRAVPPSPPGVGWVAM
jgi:hypothetical protein